MTEYQDPAPIEHVKEGLSRVISQWNKHYRFTGWLGPMLEQVDDVELAFFSILAGRNLETATGTNLDLLGRLVGVGRDNLDDERYRYLIAATIYVNISDGYPDQIIYFFDFFMSLLGVQWVYSEAYPATIWIFIEDPGDLSIGRIIGLALRVKPAGVGMSILTAPPAWQRFYYGFDTPGYGSVNAGTPGGGYAGIQSASKPPPPQPEPPWTPEELPSAAWIVDPSQNIIVSGSDVVSLGEVLHGWVLTPFGNGPNDCKVLAGGPEVDGWPVLVLNSDDGRGLVLSTTQKVAENPQREYEWFALCRITDLASGQAPVVGVSNTSGGVGTNAQIVSSFDNLSYLDGGGVSGQDPVNTSTWALVHVRVHETGPVEFWINGTDYALGVQGSPGPELFGVCIFESFTSSVGGVGDRELAYTFLSQALNGQPDIDLIYQFFNDRFGLSVTVPTV